MSHFSCTRTLPNRRSALTLLELVVVLGILALLAGVAVQTLDPIANQARYEASQRLLNDTRIAIVGEPNLKTPSGQPIATGFCADCGSLPVALNDLLVRPVAIVAYGLDSFDSDRDLNVDITLPRGWNGPYFHLGAGHTTIRDGWGNELSFLDNAGDLTVTSLGSDNDSVLPEEGYQTDISIELPVNAYAGDVVFRLYGISGLTGSRIDPTEANLLDGIASPPAGTKMLGVHFYGRNASGGTSGEIQERTCVVSMSGSFEYRISSIVLGKGAARALFWVDSNNDQLLNSGEVVLRKSYAHVFEVVPGTENRFEMELR